MKSVEIPIEENTLSIFSKRYLSDLVYQKFDVAKSKVENARLDIDWEALKLLQG
ncbi:hypothetical protein H6F89_04390 [Cyanobacteria bacterium FACHB-63]|nr:hypothetical protein [Cyanobacteria bacterium FACHB-63]